MIGAQALELQRDAGKLGRDLKGAAEAGDVAPQRLHLHDVDAAVLQVGDALLADAHLGGDLLLRHAARLARLLQLIALDLRLDEKTAFLQHFRSDVRTRFKKFFDGKALPISVSLMFPRHFAREKLFYIVQIKQA